MRFSAHGKWSLLEYYQRRVRSLKTSPDASANENVRSLKSSFLCAMCLRGEGNVQPTPGRHLMCLGPRMTKPAIYRQYSSMDAKFQETSCRIKRCGSVNKAKKKVT